MSVDTPVREGSESAEAPGPLTLVMGSGAAARSLYRGSRDTYTVEVRAMREIQRRWHRPSEESF